MEQKKIRHYDLDWLRVIAIFILLLFHTGMLFNQWGWHIKNAETSETFGLIMVWFHQWRMPLLLFISGAGTYFALGFRSPKTFSKERTKRLLIPLIFGIFVIVPPQIYFEFINKFTSYLDFYPTVFEFVPYPEGGSLSWHHLWFVLYLFLYSLICLPLFLYLRSERSVKLKNMIANLLNKKGGFAFLLIPMIISQFILRPFFPNESHDLTDLGYFVHYMLFFVAGFVVYIDKRNWQSLYEQRRLNLIITGITLVLYYIAYLVPYQTSFYSYDFIYHIPSTAMTWFTIVAFIGYGKKYLNKKSELLTQLNEGIYPFYILHQTVIITIGYYIIQWDISIMTKFIIVNFLTLLICVGIYIALIKPFNITRFLFGMKMKRIQINKTCTSDNIVPQEN